jgi:broad specificity phosphatase PhoE
MARLFLIRHAEPAAAWGGAVDDPGLSEFGRRQAETASTQLANAGKLAVLSSPMRRCRETAEPYARVRGLEPGQEPRVSEVATPAGVGDRRAWLLQNFPWQGGPARHWSDLAPELSAWREQMLGWARTLVDDSAVFTHFIAINVLVGAALARNETIVCKPGHASITELDVDDGRLRLVRLGEELRSGDVR